MSNTVGILNTLVVTESDKGFSLSEMVERVLDSCDVKDSSRSSYRYGIRDFLRWNQSGVLGSDTLVSYKRYLRSRSDLSISTKNQYLSGVRIVLRKLHDCGILERDFARGVKGFKVTSHHKRVPITDTQVARVFDLVKKESDKRLLVIFTLLYFQGLRQKELLTVKVEDFNADDRTLRIFGKGRDDSEKIDLHPQTVSLLKWFITDSQQKSGYIFPSRSNPARHITRQNLNWMIRKIHTKCGITNVGHGWRKVFVSKLIDSGMDLLTVSTFSRHQSLSMLQVYYDRIEKTKKLPKYYEVFESANILS